MDKTIKFERIFFSLETFLEFLQEIHVNENPDKYIPMSLSINCKSA